ncbi:MAG: serine/threonine protein kinase [Labilithrix sp.]|nr:serine/threonine protein kinase [Labilithrix sp.]MCW5813088.1 serine/threonine protein kinase [Labilithrix sp.]
MAAVEVPALGTMLVKRYELTSEIGRGGCAVVFEAHDHRLGRIVAVKLPLGFTGDPVKTGRFQRESRVISSIHHPNVCAVLDNGETSRGTPFIVMERLFGESLRSVLGRRTMLGVNDTISIGLQLLSALDSVHAVGIIHRDIKPDNVVLVGRGGCDPIVKLVDFGLCRRSGREAAMTGPEATMTADGAIVGTPEYMAPEQVLGTKPDVRLDVYAAGVVLYECLSGERTFFAKSVREILSGVMNKRLRPLRDIRRDVPRSLDKLVARAMARDPKSRFRSAAEMQDALCQVKDELAAYARAAHRQAMMSSGEWEPPTAKLRSFQRPSPGPIRVSASAPTPRLPIPSLPPLRHSH